MTTKVRIPRVRRRSAVECELLADTFRSRFLAHCSRREVDALHVFERVTRDLGFRPEVGTPASYVKGLTDFRCRVVQLDALMYDRIECARRAKQDPFAIFVVLHEVAGHVFTHSGDVGEIEVQFQQTSTIAFAKQSDVDDEENAEWQADRIAAGVQMPAREVLALSGRHSAMLPDVRSIARAFGVSDASAKRRQAELEPIIPELLVELRQRKDPFDPRFANRYRAIR